MATIRLTPSTYAVSNSSYVTVTNPEDMYTNTDSSTHASLRNTRNSTSNTYYVYIRGFNFDDVPANAVVSDFTIKLKGSESYMSTSSSYRMSLYHGTTAISNTTVTSSFSTTATTFTFPNGSLTWDTLKEYGSNFGIRVPLRRSSTNYSSYIYVYGAEIEVDYTLPNPVDVTSVLISGDGTISPLGTTHTYESIEYTLTITPTNKSDAVSLVRDGVDISEDLVAHGTSTTTTFTADDVTTTSISSGTSYAQYAVGHSAESPSSSGASSNMYASSGSAGYATYSFNFSSIPNNATIEEIEVFAYGHRENSTIDSTHVSSCQLYRGSNAISEEVDFPSTSSSTITIVPTSTVTRAELDNITLRHFVAYYGGLVLGISFNVTYSVGTGIDHYTYTFTAGSSDTVLEVTIGEVAPYIPPEEDPEETYYSLTISSINADTTPVNGTSRIIEGNSQTITISPLEPKLTLALDNGNDITSLLSGGPGANYTVTEKVSGATYGFELNSSTGYYESTNASVDKSASVARLNLSVTTSCILTIEYINYAEENYDYGMFGKLDTTIATDGLEATSGSSSPSDSTSNYQLAMASNSEYAQTISYNLTAGQHFIDIKYGKDDGGASGNDSLQWKVRSIEPTSGSGNYTYTLTNINQKHSLIFVFGDVNFYYITSSSTSGGRIFPDGQSVVLERDNYKITIIPDNVSSTVTMTDNGTNVTSNLNQITGVDKNNNPIVNYTYILSNITAAHNLVITIGDAAVQIYLKENGSWVPYSKVYKKINGSWVEQTDLSSIFSTTANYVKQS